MRRAQAPIVAGLALSFAAAMVLAAKANGYWVFVIATVALTALAGIGLNVLIGLAGQVSFGHVGFYAIGAYTVAILASSYHVSPWIGLPLAALAAGVTGLALAIPALRVRGPYLAMVTIAFGFIVENGIVEWRAVTGGQNGIMGVPPLSIPGLPAGERCVAIVGIALVAVALCAYAKLARGTWGHAIRAVRDSEVAAESAGLDPVVVKTVAFTISAAVAGLAGGLFAPLSGFVTPSTFGFPQSILFVLVVLIGGAGTTLGPLVGAMLVVLLPEMLSGLAEYRLLFFGALLLVVLWVAPRGVAGGIEAWLAHRRQTKAQARIATDVLQLPHRDRGALEAQGLTIRFGGVNALTQFALVAKPGRVHALIGPNGAGKTTALNLLSGFYEPQEGRMRLGGAMLRAGRACTIARAGVSRTYQTSQLFGSLGAGANLALARLRGRLGPLLGEREIVSSLAASEALLAFVGFAGDAAAPSDSLPHVDRRLVEIARALAADPDVILLDEPAAGLSHDDKAQLSGLLRRIAAHGIGVVLVEHDMALVMGCSDEITVLESGAVIAHGTPAQIRANAEVRRAYLGDAMPAGGAGGVRRSTDGRPLLEVGKLIAGYGAGDVLKGVDLRLRDGEMIAVLGANGAGKSTLMRSIAGLHRPVRGGIALDGAQAHLAPAHRLVARGLVLVPEGRHVFAELTVRDNLRLGAFLSRGDIDADVAAMLERFPRLRERLTQRAGLLSGGEQQMLAIARGLMARPRVLLLDEVLSGLNNTEVDEALHLIRDIRDRGTTIIFVEHLMRAVNQLSDRVAVLDGGALIALGEPKEVMNNSEVVAVYLGKAHAT